MKLITDPSIDLNRTKEYNLSIRVSPDGFSFSVINPQENRLLALEHYPAIVSSENFLGRRLLEWSNDRKILQNKYAYTRLIYSTDKITIVPGELYNYEKQNEIAFLVFGKQNGFSCHDNYLSDEGSNLVFYVADSFLEACDQRFSDYVLIHPIAILNKKIKAVFKDNHATLALYFKKKSFCLLLYLKEKLHLVNNYNFLHINDVIFYTISLLKQHDISYTDTNLLLSGEIIPEGELHLSLKKYFSQNSILDPGVIINPDIFKDSLHRFISLL